MKANLASTLWPEALEAIRACHVSKLQTNCSSDIKWREAFALLVQAIEEERVVFPDFAEELSELTDETETSYSFNEILEEYFDFLEEKEDWIAVIASCNQIVRLFKWEQQLPSQFMYRKGNAFLKSSRLEEAEAFGKEWLEKYPNDLYAATSNVFLLITLDRFEEAKAITERFLASDLVSEDAYDTFFMAAFRLYEVTDDINAKQRIEQKIAEYNKLMGR